MDSIKSSGDLEPFRRTWETLASIERGNFSLCRILHCACAGNEEVRVDEDRDVLVASPLKIYYLEGYGMFAGLLTRCT